MLLRRAASGSTRAASSWSNYPWTAAAVGAVASAALFFLLPALAPGLLSGASDELLLGLVTGIVVGVAVRFDARVAPIVGLGAFVGVTLRFLVVEAGPPVVAAIAVVIAVEMALLIVSLQRLDAWRLASPQDVLVLVALAVIAGLVASCLVAILLRWGDPSIDEFFHIVRTWATDDVFGLLCIAPVFMTARIPRIRSWRSVVEYGLVLLFTVEICVFMFRVVTPGNAGLLGWPYLVLIGPLWIAVRFGVVAVAPITAVVSWFAVVSTVDGYGAFSQAAPEARDRLVAVQLFCIVLAITLLLLGVLRDARARSMGELRESARLLREVVDGADALVFAKAYDEPNRGKSRYVLVNEAWARYRGLTLAEALGQSDPDVFENEEAARYASEDRQVIERDERITFEHETRSASGESRHLSISKFPLRHEDGSIWGVGGIASDTTDLLHAFERERRQGDLLKAVFEQSPTPALRVSMADSGEITVLAANAAMLALLNMVDADLAHFDFAARLLSDDAPAAMGLLRLAQQAGWRSKRAVVRQREVRLVALDGAVIWTRMSAAAIGSSLEGGASEVVIQFEDFTARRRAEEALSDQALRDEVTTLPNRRALHDRLEAALARSRADGGMVAALFCDLDRFKDVNDTQGHQAGDLLLVEVARRLQAALRPEDTVARLGGDEFVALAEGLTDAGSAIQLAMRLLDRVAMPWTQGEQTYRPSISIGVAVVDDPSVTADEVLRRADLAMYRAKDNGRGRIEVYEKSVDDSYQHAVALQHDLRRAIDSGDLVLHYQPIVLLSDATVVGAEALVRLRGRDGSLLAPSWFVPQAESTGLILPMGAWVVRQAIGQIRAWTLAGHDLSVSVNVSASQLRDEGFADFVLAQIDAAGLDPRRLAVEVTETALINEPGRSARELTALSREGVGIYLDDFGTGYSSLSWLTQFPVNVVKIDRSFTDELGVDERKTAIVSALIQVSHELGFSVVAEGVETVDQAGRLVELGCDRAQGFLYGHPVAVDTFVWT